MTQSALEFYSYGASSLIFLLLPILRSLFASRCRQDEAKGKETGRTMGGGVGEAGAGKARDIRGSRAREVDEVAEATRTTARPLG